MSWLEKLKNRWGVHSIWQVLLILCVFACTGFTILFIKKPIYSILGYTEQTPAWWVKVITWIVLILPLYNIVLLAYGFVFGQFRFFWLFVNKLFGRFLFWRRKKS